MCAHDEIAHTQHTHTHTQIHTHTRTHTYTNTHMHTYTHTALTASEHREKRADRSSSPISVSPLVVPGGPTRRLRLNCGIAPCLTVFQSKKFSPPTPTPPPSVPPVMRAAVVMVAAVAVSSCILCVVTLPTSAIASADASSTTVSAPPVPPGPSSSEMHAHRLHCVNNAVLMKSKLKSYCVCAPDQLCTGEHCTVGTGRARALVGYDSACSTCRCIAVTAEESEFGVHACMH